MQIHIDEEEDFCWFLRVDRTILIRNPNLNEARK